MVLTDFTHTLPFANLSDTELVAMPKMLVSVNFVCVKSLHLATSEM